MESGPPAFECRPGCAACCIAPSISSALPGMGSGKAAGIPCPALTPDLLCLLYGRQERPKVCSSFKASRETCGSSREEAMAILEALEAATAPAFPKSSS